MRFHCPRHSPQKRPAFWLAVGVAVLLASPLAWACSVPVFRYALERWQSDPYQVVVFHRGELSAEQEPLVNRLGPEGQAGRTFANVKLVTVDLAALDANDQDGKEMLALWEAQQTETLPWMVVRYPSALRIAKPIWAGPPSEEAIDRLLDSPKRREIARRILGGDTAVWVLLESGNSAADNAALLTLKTQLQLDEKNLELPPADPQDVADGLISVDQAALKIKFSIVKLSREEAQEVRFVDTLLDSEPDLRSNEFAGQPMAFPIFGRGRALYALIGKGINADMISQASEGLVGPCTCQVKEQNPGTDLLMAVDWERLVAPQIHEDDALPPLPVFSGFSASEALSTLPGETRSAVNTSNTEETEAAATDPTLATTTTVAEPPKAAASPVMTTTLICLAAGIAGVAVISFFLVKSET